MTEYINVITKDGKNRMLQTAFYGGTGDPFRYGAVGKGVSTPTEESTGLTTECAPNTETGYARAALTNTFDAATKQVTSEFTLSTSNITPSTNITEVGIVDGNTLGQGVFWCVCQIPSTPKDNTKTLKFTIATTFI